MKTPKKEDELQQFRCAANWMRTAVSEYAKLVAPLQSAIDMACNGVEKRTKRALSRIQLVHVWGAAHEEAFNGLKYALANATSLGYPKEQFPSVYSPVELSDICWL